MYLEEHSGFYNAYLLRLLYQEVAASIWLENPLQIKRSIGLQRGKDDALNALDFQRKARLWKPRSYSLDRLALLISHRDRMVKSLMSIKGDLQEQGSFVCALLQQEMETLNQPVIEASEKIILCTITLIEKSLKERIKCLSLTPSEIS